MPDINRAHNPNRYEEMHTHVCPNCARPYTCLCVAQPEQHELVCKDCETATYDPAIHGGHGEKEEA